MATIGEANDITVLLRWVSKLTDNTGDITASERAKAAAVRLAGRANKALQAGLHPEQVAADWPQPAGHNPE
ncbi:hypothetical protein SAMN05421805_12776 [Saccharopolyspora antimicrobica]|uniref:Uncharacterized protein n=1 Tax=Saccharopolyspora antimicrobica TaxID=455193 RepID=A0A1I5KLP6_9PSEU|nr:hypothetical protein [Saccharopolyspora antimicrobica]RKT85621.1 hypothetical protein ATL45_3968 [Saccharopolyspora antimicrobica]SFO86020.1 hypothetical protein SAMN05421805_12776 [Saccharopolyspora antimicrobica]